jgi:hypothetical protein
VAIFICLDTSKLNKSNVCRWWRLARRSPIYLSPYVFSQLLSLIQRAMEEREPQPCVGAPCVLVERDSQGSVTEGLALCELAFAWFISRRGQGRRRCMKVAVTPLLAITR